MNMKHGYNVTTGGGGLQFNIRHGEHQFGDAPKEENLLVIHF